MTATATRSAADAGPPTGEGGRPLKVTDRAKSERRLGWMLCAPAVFVMLLVTAYPIGYALWLSFQRYDLRFPDEQEFVGIDNYTSVLSSPLWWDDVANTFTITIISVFVELVLGMGLALVMHRALFGRAVARTTILVPYAIVTVVAALAWRFAFDPTTGFVNGLLGFEDEAWFDERLPAMVVIIATEVWKTTPFMALLLLAGLVLVPDDALKAARVDGAGNWYRFRKITLPLMKPAILVTLLFRTLDAFRIFDSVFVQTRGSVGTETVSILGYNQLLNWLNLGIGSAVSVLIFILVLLIAFAFTKVLGADLGQQRGER